MKENVTPIESTAVFLFFLFFFLSNVSNTFNVFSTIRRFGGKRIEASGTRSPSYTDINARGIPVATSYNSNAVQFSELFSLSLMFVKAD